MFYKKFLSIIVATVMAYTHTETTWASGYDERSSTNYPEDDDHGWEVAVLTTARGSQCRPKCRSGYICDKGKCVDACNPSCPNGFICSEKGDCERLDKSSRSSNSGKNSRNGKRLSSSPDFRDSVVVVRPRFHKKTRALFVTLSKFFAENITAAEKDDTEIREIYQTLSEYYQRLSESPGHGTGWFVIDPAGGAWVITNRHVAGQADTVMLEWPDGQFASIDPCPVVFTERKHDLAIIRVSKKQLPRKLNGLHISQSPLREGDEVFAIGFPGFNSKAVYQYTNGIVNNAKFPLLDHMVIQHSATIDAGNSGGPLVAPDPRAPTGFGVVGVNTWRLRGRVNGNLAIPSETVAKTLQAAGISLKLSKNDEQMLAALKKAGNTLALELSSSKPDVQGMYNLISYSMVAARGIDLFSALWKSQDAMTKEQLEDFIEHPVEFMRESLFRVFVRSYSSSNVASIKLERIYEQDLPGIANGKPIRTVYSVGDQKKEVIWTFEHGSWKIQNATLAIEADRDSFLESIGAKNHAGSKSKNRLNAHNRPGSHLFKLERQDALLLIYDILASVYPGQTIEEIRKNNNVLVGYTAGSRRSHKIKVWLVEATANSRKENRSVQGVFFDYSLSGRKKAKSVVLNKVAKVLNNLKSEGLAKGSVSDVNPATIKRWPKHKFGPTKTRKTQTGLGLITSGVSISSIGAFWAGYSPTRVKHYDRLALQEPADNQCSLNDCENELSGCKPEDCSSFIENREDYNKKSAMHKDLGLAGLIVLPIGLVTATIGTIVYVLGRRDQRRYGIHLSATPGNTSVMFNGRF